MNKIKATLLVSPMGHDVNRVSELLIQWMEDSGLFIPTRVGTFPGSKTSINDFFADDEAVRECGLYVFICPHDCFNEASRRRIEQEVASGKPVLFCHGLHPAFRDWPEAEKMIGLLWRDTAMHGDFGYCDVHIEKEHPITQGLTDFSTKEELFCGLTNVWNVPLEVLVSAYSKPDLVSRHNQHGTGNDEPVLTLGHYGKGVTADFLLGHVWPYYTGHGLLENTMIAFEPSQVKTLYLRTCEYICTGSVCATLNA